MKGKRRIILVILLSLVYTFVFQQDSTKDELIARKRKIEEEIELANKLLEQTRTKRNVSIQEYKLLEATIRKRNVLIKELERDIDYLDNEIGTKIKKLQSLKADLEKTKKEYSELIYFAFKNRNTDLDFMYLLASEDINQFYSRYIYLQQYKEYRLKNLQLIIALKKLIENEIISLEGSKREKVNTVNKILREKATLVKNRRDIDNVIKDLGKQEEQLDKDIKEKKAIKEKLEKEIEDIIKKEAKKKTYKDLTPEEKIISDDFVKNKGRLPWPTEMGVITDRFGEHDHPVIKNLKVRNHGIDISTVPSAKARVVFDGVVTKVFSIKGANNTVIVRHGNFYTVYHNLSEVYVKTGDIVKRKDILGIVYTDTLKGESIIHFEVWHELDKQNPEDWLSN